jgi:hypothetical protein
MTMDGRRWSETLIVYGLLSIVLAIYSSLITEF